MAVSPGAKLGPYEVLAFVGSGGMGEVYRARDSRLGRDVALKVLRHDRAADASRRRRLIREARTASALNHPNIATIHDIASIDGTDVIVMEYVDGRPLSARVRSGLTLDESIAMGVAVADALAHAHAAGIVHCDLKPANVGITGDGTVKVLDFGLARLVSTAEVAAGDETATDERAAAAGGTPGYMSPEQATGAPADARSDVFSFGAMLYEMVTRRRAFDGASPAETLAAVIRDDPAPPGALVPELPPNLERLIGRCLRKDPDRRWQHMGDVKIELEEIAAERQAAKAATTTARSRVSWILGAAAVVAAAVVLLWLALPTGPRPTPRLVPLTTTRGVEATPSFSPDGTQVVYASDGETRLQGTAPTFDIWLRLVGRSEARRLTTDPADDMGPSWSPDGRTIAFQRGRPGAAGTIYLVSPLGGAERKLSDFPAAWSDTTWFRGAAVPQLSWSSDSRWLAAARAPLPDGRATAAGGIHLIPIEGGEPRRVTSPRPPAVDRDPAFSPDGRRLAYASCTSDAFAACDVHVLELDEALAPRGPARRLTRQDLTILGLAWTRDGRSIVYGGARLDFAHLWQVRADGSAPPERLEAARRGLSPAIARGRDRLAFAQHLSDNDIHAFEPGRPDVPVVTSSSPDHGPAFSPDGRRIAFESGRSGDVEEIWLAAADGTGPTQLTHGPGGWQGSPSWSPDGRRIAFDSRGADGFFDIWTIDVDGSGLRRATTGPLNENLPVWSRDGRWIYYREERPEGREIWRVPSAGGPPERVTQGGGFRATESPDGRTLFFVQKDDDSPLLAQPVTGGPARQIVNCVVSRSLTTGPDGIYYVGCPPGRQQLPIVRLNPATGIGQILGMAATGGGFVPGMAVSPDARRILYAKVVADGADLMLIEDYR